MNGTESTEQTPSTPEQPSVPTGGETLSQLVARILDQLSISAWLPSAALVFLLLLIGHLRQANGDLERALDGIGSMSVASLVLLIGAVVVATMLTQAFTFEAIRFFEGYWGPGTYRNALGLALSRRHLAKRDRLRRRLREASAIAFDVARPDMQRRGIPREVVAVIQALRDMEPTDWASDADLRRARDTNWLDHAPAAARRQIDGLEAALSLYPTANHRVLPTRFGNTLRAYEERAHRAGAGALEGFVQRIFHELPAAVQSQHDKFRARLDLYCSLLIVFIVSGATGIGLLAEFGLRTIAVTAATTFVLSVISYRAAIASARGYGGILVDIAQMMAHRPVAASAE